MREITDEHALCKKNIFGEVVSVTRIAVAPSERIILSIRVLAVSRRIRYLMTTFAQTSATLRTLSIQLILSHYQKKKPEYMTLVSLTYTSIEPMSTVMSKL